MTVEHITPASASVLDDLGTDPDYVAKGKLAVQIHKAVQDMGLSQRDAAIRMGISEPKLSLLTRGKLNGLSQAALEDCLSALGHDFTPNLLPFE